MDGFEAAFSVYVVRFGIVLGALGLGIANWVRTSRLERQRFSIPDDLSANVKRLRHEVESVDESLRVHVAKEVARVSRAERKEADRAAQEVERAPAVATVAPSAPAPSEGPRPTLTDEQVKLGLSRAIAERSAKRRTRRSA